MTESWYKPSRRERKEQLRKDSEQRKVEWDKLSLTEKIAYLDNLFGHGRGATRQRARYQAALEAEIKAKEVKTAADKAVKKKKKTKKS